MKSIFLSHSSVDKPFVRELHKFLEYQNIKSWIDEAEITIGDSLISKIAEGIKLADFVAIILSPNSINSEWVKKELKLAMIQEKENGKKKILPILIENCEIPKYLHGKKYGDFRTSSKSLSGLMELLKILKNQKNNKQNIKQTNENLLKEHKNFIEIYDDLTSSGPFSPARFGNLQAKKLAKILCKKQNYRNYALFLELYDDLTSSGPFSPARFGKEEAIEDIFKKLNITNN